MRVGLLIYGSLETVSGGYLYDRKLVDFLRCQGDAVEIISLPWRNYARHLADNLAADLLQHLLRLPLDVLVQDELNHPSLFYLNQRLRDRASYPIISLVHHLRCSELRPAWQNALYQQVERAYLASVDGFIFNSQTTRRAVGVVCPEAAERPFVVASPAADHLAPQIGPGQVVERAHEAGPLRLIFVGNLIERKGLHLLIEALARLPQGAATLAVVGGRSDRRYAERLEAQVRRAGLGEQVTFYGYLPQPELAQQLAWAQVLAVPSSYEGFGIVYLEGMGYGLPALAGEQGAAHEVIRHGENGFVLPVHLPAGVERLAEHLRRLAEDRELLERLARAAWLAYHQHPGWEEMGQAVRGFLQERVLR